MHNAQDNWGDTDYELWGPSSGTAANKQQRRQQQAEEEEEEEDLDGHGPWGSAWRLRAAMGAATGDAICVDPDRMVENKGLELMMQRGIQVCECTVACVLCMGEKKGVVVCKLVDVQGL